METRETIARLLAIFAAAEEEHPEYIIDGVLSPVYSKVVDLCLDALGVPEDTTLDYPNGDARAFCRDWFWSELYAGNIEEVVKELRKDRYCNERKHDS